MKYLLFVAIYIPVFVVCRYVIRKVFAWKKKRNMPHK